MRKANRQKDAEWTFEVFDKAPFVTLSMMRRDGTPYGLPLSLVRKNANLFYFHCAGEGEKLDCLQNNPHVSLSAVSKCTPKFEPEKNNFTEYYHSAVAAGTAEIVTDKSEKIEALRLLCQRFLPQYMEHFEDAIARSLESNNTYGILFMNSAPKPVASNRNECVLYPADLTLSTVNGEDDGSLAAVIAEFTKVDSLPGSEIQSAVSNWNGQRNTRQ